MLKQFATAAFSLLCSAALFSNEYKVSSISYQITGKTKLYAVQTKVPVDTNKVYHTEEEFMNFIRDFKQQLENTREFENVDIDYVVCEPDLKNRSNVFMLVSLKDAYSFIAMPYPKYDSNNGFIFKLKMKDTNFLGSLNTMSSDVNFAIQQDSEDESAAPDIVFGFNLSFDYPFKVSFFDATWTNDYGVTYTIGDKSPEWSLNTGVTLEKAFKQFAVDITLKQSSYRDFDYEKYGDDTYFAENAKLSVPITLQDVPNWGKIKYTPYISAAINWDFDGINEENDDLSSPLFEIGQTIGTSRINWKNNFRTGISASTTQSFAYNLQTDTIIPGISGELEMFKGFRHFGINSDFYAFAYLGSSKKIGDRLRGIRDDQYFNTDSGHGNEYACKTPAAITGSVDLPVHIFTTHFTKGKLLSKLNFELQMSPFVDFAFVYNKATGTVFYYKDGFYAGGIEFLVFPVKWSSIQVRGSIGADLGRYLPDKITNKEWRDNVSKFEYSIGIGLQY